MLLAVALPRVPLLFPLTVDRKAQNRCKKREGPLALPQLPLGDRSWQPGGVSLSIAPCRDPLKDVANTYLVGYSPRRITPRAILKAVSPALVVLVKPDASLLSQREPVYCMGKSRKGGKFDMRE